MSEACVCHVPHEVASWRTCVKLANAAGATKYAAIGIELNSTCHLLANLMPHATCHLPHAKCHMPDATLA